MKVRDLIKFLKKQPQDLDVGYGLYSEYALMKEADIVVMEACQPRPDGWVHSKRPDKPTQEYLMFPGN